MASKAVKERRFRQKEQERKRFDIPMRVFLEQKYPKIYQEYRDLYNTVNRIHPDTRDLTKTCTFKAWLYSLNHHSTTDILTHVVKETLDPEQTSISSTEENQILDPEQTSISSTEENQIHSLQNLDHSFQTDREVPQTAEESELVNSQNLDQSFEPLTQTPEAAEQLFKVIASPSQRPTDESNEAAAVIVNINDLADIMANVEDSVDQIMNELDQDPVVRDILNEPADEGIEINPLDDIEYDIEPFDFNVEVENYEW